MGKECRSRRECQSFSLYFLEVTTLEQTEKQETVQQQAKSRPKRKSKRTVTKPQGYKEFETLAKEILEAEGVSYFEWLHEKHQEIILNFNLSNQKEIAELAREEE